MYGNGTSIHRESEMFSYWHLNGGGDGPSLYPILQQQLGQVMVDHVDILARNAHFLTPMAQFAGGVSGVSTLDAANSRMTTELLDSVWLSLKGRALPFRPYTQINTPDELVCVTSEGAIHDLKREVGTSGALSFVDVNRYTEAGRQVLYAGELGTYRGVRFVQSQMAKLPNVGAITHQTAIKAAVKPGEGAPDPKTTLVDGVHKVGQPDAKHYIEVADASGFNVGDEVTIHRERHTSGTLATEAYFRKGVLNGVVYDDPMVQTLRIHSIDTAATPDRITFVEPYLMTEDNGKGLETDLGSATFGYVTKGRWVHTSLFINPNESGIVCGVSQPPVIYTPPPYDDYMSIFRIAYDMWMKYQLWEPHAYRLVFHVGANPHFNGSIFY